MKPAWTWEKRLEQQMDFVAQTARKLQRHAAPDPLDRVASALERIAIALEQPRADVYLIGKKEEDE